MVEDDGHTGRLDQTDRPTQITTRQRVRDGIERQPLALKHAWPSGAARDSSGLRAQAWFNTSAKSWWYRYQPRHHPRIQKKIRVLQALQDLLPSKRPVTARTAEHIRSRIEVWSRKVARFGLAG